MPTLSKSERIDLFMSLFRGRSDIFAQRWDKSDGSFSGYFPVYTDRTKKNLAPLTSSIIEAHLLGNKVIGIYPLLTDNTSYFVAADFDGSDWLESAKRVLEICSAYDLPAYIERSRSGSGCHVWWFFEHQYPAYKGRKIFLHILKESGVVAPFDKEDSFDRLFPSQDYLSGKGFGNLIALPLQGIPRKVGNSVFLDPDNDFQPAVDQWEFLQSVKRMPVESLDHLYGEFTGNKPETEKSFVPYAGSEIPVTVSNVISIPKSCITKDIANFLTDKLNFFNTEYAVKEKMGLSNYKTEKYFKTVVDADADVFLPRGFLDQLLSYFSQNNISFVIDDRRLKLEPIKLTPTFTLHEYQQRAIDAFIDHDQGILVAPPGSGKTIMGLALIAEKAQPALILTHRKQIYTQWLDRIESFFSIPKRNIGQIAGIKKEAKNPITVAMIQSLARMKNVSDVSQFGTVLVDECHHVPAQMFRKVITQFNPNCLYGLTATPMRKHNDEKLIFIYLGDIIHEVSKGFVQSEKSSQEQSRISVVVKETSLSFPHKVKSQDYQLLARTLTFDTSRNQFIAGDIASEAKAGKKCLVLTERKEHIEILGEYLKQEFEIIALSGDLTPKQRREKIAQIQSGHYQIILATGQLIGEGTHFEKLDCLFLV